MPIDRRSRPYIVAASCLGSLTLSFAINLPAICLTTIADHFAFDKAAGGLFLSCAFAGLFLAILTTGPAADRWGIRVPLVLSAVTQSLGFLICGMASTRPTLFLGAFVLGTGTGMVDALLTPLVCATYPEIRTRVSNLLHAFYPIGIATLAAATMVLFHLRWTWQEIYRLMAILALPYGIAFLFLPLPASLHVGDDRLQTRRLIRQRPFLLIVTGMFLGGIAELGPSQWLPAYVEEAMGGSRMGGFLGLLIFGLTMSVGRLLYTWLSHHITPRQFFTAGGAVAAAGLLLASLPGPTVFTVACLAALGLGIAGFWATILAVAGDRFPKAGASMYSLLGAAGNSGGVAGPLLIGIIAEAWGLRAAMALLALAPMLAVIVFQRLLHTGKNV